MGSESNEDDDRKTLSNFPTSSLTNSAHAHALLQSPPNSGTRTPPIYTTASVPFRWEEEPGKPRPCTALLTFPTAALELQLPPRLLHLSSSDSKMTSPTTVLDEGPYNVEAGIQNQSSSISRSMRFKSSSFGSSPDYDDISSSCSRSGVLGDMVLIKNRGKGKTGFFRPWPAGKKSNSHGRKVEDDDDVDFSFFKEDEIIKMGRNGSFISHPKPSPSSFLATLCEGIKQVISLKMSRGRTQVKKKKNPNPNPKRFIT